MLVKSFFAKRLLFKLTTLVLVFLFAFQPLAPAFAQLLDSGDTIVDAPAPEPAPVPEPAPTSEPAPEPEPEQQPTEPENQPAEALQSTEEEPANDQTQPSQTSQKLPEIDKNTGALSYGYSIAVPPGRNNLQPDIALSYNSNLSDQNSAFGYGWAINIPYIQRLNKAGTDSLYSSNYFYSSLDGELSSVDGTSYIARTENGQFNKYTFSNNQWTLTAKNGTQYKFGYEASSQQNDPNNINNIYKWMLQETRDTNNNYISYFYFKDEGQIYPLAIKYTGNGATDGIFEINFQRTSTPLETRFLTGLRADNAVSYATGFAVISNYLINEIYAKINNNWVSKYVLNYAANQNTNRPLLTSVILSGKDNLESITTLPATTFNYQLGGEGWSLQNASWSLPAAPEGEWDLNSKPPQFVDFNGDGLPDLSLISHGWINTENTASEFYRNFQYLNTGSGWTQTSNWEFPSLPDGESSWQWHSIPAQFADLNGDGLTDLLLVSYRYISHAVGGVLTDQEYINNGHGWTKADNSFHYPLPPEGYEWNLRSRPPQLANLNGDGLPDLTIIGRETSNPLGNTNKDYQWLNNGSGWTQTSTWEFPPLPVGEEQWRYPNIPLQLTDLNGDGLTDLILVASHYNFGNINTYYQYLNNGSGWTQTSTWNFPSDLPAGETDWQYFNILPNFADFNSDGLADLLLVASHYNFGTVLTYYQYLNNGNGWTQTSVWNFPPVPEGETAWQYFNTPPNFPDLNGDGLADLILIASHNNFGTIYTCYQYLNIGSKQNLLAQINYPQGGNSAVNYKAVNGLPFPIFTVLKITNSDGFGNNSNFSYKYNGPAYYYNNAFDRNLAGFAQIIQTDSAQNITKTYYHTNENYFKIGKPYKVEQYDSSGKLFLASMNKWEATNLAGSAGFVKLAETVEQNFGTSANHKDKAESFVYDNSTGNQTQKTEWGEVVADSSGNFSDVGQDKRITNFSYATGGISNFQFSISNQFTNDQNGTKIKESRYYYDNLPLGQLTLGNQTKEENWIKENNYAISQKDYNNFGLVVKSTDANNNATNFIYDSYNLYPATVKNALNQTSQFVYNYVNAKPMQTIDANGNIFKNTFDGLGRILKTEQPDQAMPSTLVIKTTYAYTDIPNSTNVLQTDYLDSSIFVNSYNYYDGLGRMVQTKKSAETNNFETKDFVYDVRGNLQKETVPYNSSGFSKTSAASLNQLYTNYAYDALNRKTSITNSTGATNSVYGNWQTTITDANSNKKDFVYNAYNKLVAVNEYPSAGSGQVTNYTYDTAGNLIKITDALGNIRNFTYDALGRKLTADGFTYVYDNASNLVSVTDPKNQTINYAYDALNRKISEDFIGQDGIEAVFTYDNCLNGKGKLCKTVSAVETAQFEYSALGNITKNTKIIDFKNYITAYSYDNQGNQVLISNPDGSQIKYDFNTAGLIERVWRKESADANFLAVINNIDYSPAEQITTVSYANGAQTTNTYDSAKLYRLINKITTSATGTQLQNISYQYDNIGNILFTTDNSATDSRKTVAYTYDNLYRLTSASASNTANNQNYTQNFVYDALGNILSQTTNGKTLTYSYQGAKPGAVTSISDGIKTTNYSYDNNGNLIAEGDKTFTFDYNNRMVESSLPGAVEPPPSSPSITVVFANGGESFKERSVLNIQWKSNNVSKVYIYWQAYTASGSVANKVAIAQGVSATLGSYKWTIPMGFVLGHPNASRMKIMISSVAGGQGTGAITDLSDNYFKIVPASSKIPNTPSPAKDSTIVAPSKIITTYAYDPSGQRIKVATANYSLPTTNSVTIYPTQNYNITGTTATKHIFAPSAGSGQATMNIATVQGTGNNAKIYYNSADFLNSSSVLTDSTGAIAETLDYYPYGAIRIDNKVGTFAEQRKYIGQEYDEATGLNYLNARYYNSAIARFIAQDPVALSTPEKLLTDPQQLNLYSYARNNPLIYVDSSGKYAELVFVACGPLGLGAHGYINIVPEQGADLSQYNVNGGDGSHYTIGGYPDSWNPITNKLQVQINESGNYNTSDSQRLATIPLIVPEGQTTAQYDGNLLSSGYDFSQQNLGDYAGLGSPTWMHKNSGNAWTQTVINAGGAVPNIQDVYYGPGVFGKNTPHLPYGSGHSTDTPWAVSSAVQTTGQAISYAGQVVLQTASTISQSALDGMSASISRISSIINSLKTR